MLANGRAAWKPPASIDIERRPILHARFIAQDAVATLFDDQPLAPITAGDIGVDAENCGPELRRWSSVPDSGDRGELRRDESGTRSGRGRDGSGDGDTGGTGTVGTVGNDGNDGDGGAGTVGNDGADDDGLGPCDRSLW